MFKLMFVRNTGLFVRNTGLCDFIKFVLLILGLEKNLAQLIYQILSY